MKALQNNFNGGEFSPEFYGRSDLAKYRSGLATCRNFIVTGRGPVVNRPGFKFVAATKYANRRSRLIPFQYNAEQTYVLEIGHEYIRFHTQGGTVLDGGVPYEVATDYAEGSVPEIGYVQSADVLTLVHPSYPPRELRRLAEANWELVDIDFDPSLPAPASATAVATVGTGSTTYTYVVTALNDGLEESVASPVATCTNNLLVVNNYNTVSWAAVTGATHYRIYKDRNGVKGYIGTATGSSFQDDNIAPDLLITPPVKTETFDTATAGYPGAVGYFEQRRVFAGFANQPQTVWATRSGTESNLTESNPVQDNDAIAFTIASRQVNSIRHVLPLNDLLLLTSGAEWAVSATDGNVLTPSGIRARPQSYVGATMLPPVLSSNIALFVGERNNHVYDLGYSLSADGYTPRDMSLLAAHLFDSARYLADWTYAQVPYSTAWMVRNDGVLLGFTYLRDHEVYAWHRHDTDGYFESVCAVAEAREDVLYAVVARDVGGATVRYLEFMETRHVEDVAEGFFVDAGLTYDGAPATTISGLDHLEGKTVAILADGDVLPQQVVVDGAVTLSEPAELVHIGLPITAQLATLPVVLDGVEAQGQGRRLSVTEVMLRLVDTRGGEVGPSLTQLAPWAQRTDEAWGAPVRLFSGDVRLPVPADWTDGGQVWYQQVDPLPVTITALLAEVAVGG